LIFNEIVRAALDVCDRDVKSEQLPNSTESHEIHPVNPQDCNVKIETS